MKLLNIYDLKDRFPKLATNAKHLASQMQDVKAQVEEKRVLDKTEKEVVRRIQTNHELLNYEVFSKAYKTEPIDEHLIVLEANSGKSFTGDVYQLYKAMLLDNRLSDYDIVWIYSERYELETLTRYLPYDERVRFVSRSDKEYQRVLATAGYYFNDEAAPLWYVKRDGQTYVNVWHSTPFQKMGYDRGYDAKNPFPIRSWLRNYLMSDYIIANDERSADVLVRSYKLENSYRGQFLIGQSPRKDAFANTDKAALWQRLEDAGIDVNPDKETLLWVIKANLMENNDYRRFVAEAHYMMQHLQQRYNIVIDVSDAMKEKLEIEQLFTGHLFPNELDINEMMTLADVIVSTDSTLFYDVVGTGKPVYFYDFDKVDWENTYFNKSDVANATVYTIMELCVALENPVTPAVKETFDGRISQRYVDAIFFGDIAENVTVRQLRQDKTKVLFYAGDMKDNFITHRFLNILNKMDMDQYDITLLLSSNDLNENSYEQLRRIAHVVRPIFHQGYAAFTEKEAINDKKIRQYGLVSDFQDSYPKEGYMRETRRIFGDTHFDIAIDFKGDDFYWSRYIAESNSSYKVLMQQYDMEYRYNTAVRKKAKHRQASLHSMITYYQAYDQVVMIKRHYDKNRAFAQSFAPLEYISYYDIDDRNPDVAFPYYEAKEDKVMQYQHLARQIQFNHYGKVTLYPNLEDLTQTLTLTVNEETDAEGTAHIIFNDEEYIQLSINDIVFGWVKASEVTAEYNYVTETRTVNEYACVKYPKGHTIYSAPYKTQEDVYMIGSARMLHNIIVHVDEEVVTQKTIYCHIAIDGEVIGYIDRRALKPVKTTALMVRQNHLRHKDQIAERLLYSEEMDAKAVLRDYEHTDIYTKSYGSYRCEVSELTSDNLARRPLQITWMVKTAAGTSYEFVDDFNQHGWVRAEDLEFIN